MTSIIKFHTLSGAYDESPPCYILQVDDFRFLLDCGWDEHFNRKIIKELRRYAHQIDAVLLTYPDCLHLGALPYAVGKCGLNCPIYATIPVYKMGQMFMYDLYQSRHNMEDFDLFTLDDVDSAFDKIIQLKYNQSVAMKGKGYGITVTPLAAGHMIGGTVWKIVKVGEEEIIYSVDYNHKKERHLNGCELDKFSRPSLLITDTFNVLYQQARRRTRDEKLMTNILQTLRNGGNVLIAVDTAGRMLELVHMLDQLWRNRDSGLIAYSLAIINNVSYNVVEFAKSQIEWMSDKLMKSFEGARTNPFQFKHVQLCHSLTELNRVPSPKVVLASSSDMEYGFSRDLFLQWAGNANNSIIITSRTSPGTLARELIELKNKTLTLEVKKRVRLEGAELEEYQKKEREKKMLKENMSVELSSDSEDEAMNVIKGKHDLLIRPLYKQQSFFKSSKKHFPMYPFFEEKVKWDDYGEFLKDEECKIVDVLNYGEDKDMYDSKDDDIPDPTEVPSKCISFTRTINVEAQIQFIDFEGRSDGESIKKIISNVKPRRLIFIRGSPESTNAAVDYAVKYMDSKVYAPQYGEIIDVTSETHIYQVRLTDAMASSLIFKKGKDVELAWIDARIVYDHKRKEPVEINSAENESSTTNQNLVNEPVAEIEEQFEDVYKLEPLPVNQITGHQPTFINELKLSDFKQVLSKCNIPTEILGGVLYCCNGTVAVRRIESGKIILEGCLSEDYYKIRELLYEQYAII